MVLGNHGKEVGSPLKTSKTANGLLVRYVEQVFTQPNFQLTLMWKYQMVAYTFTESSGLSDKSIYARLQFSSHAESPDMYHRQASLPWMAEK